MVIITVNPSLSYECICTFGNKLNLFFHWSFYFISQHIKYFCPTYINSIYSQCFPVTSSCSQWFSADSNSWQRCCCSWSVLFWSSVFVLFLSQWLASRHVARVYKTPWDIGKTWLIDWLVGWLVWWMDEWIIQSISVYAGWRKLVALLLQVCQHDFTLILDIVVLMQEVCFCSYQQTGVSVMP
jgi:hypothetical protein